VLSPLTCSRRRRRHHALVLQARRVLSPAALGAEEAYASVGTTVPSEPAAQSRRGRFYL
jgi:hypothetical protein